jgi:DNA-binding Xre family transcriptional regulator
MAEHLHFEWRLRALIRQQRIAGPTMLAARLRTAGFAISVPQCSRLLTRAPRRISLDLLAALCTVLRCSLEDLLLLVRDAPGASARRMSAPPMVRLR